MGTAAYAALEAKTGSPYEGRKADIWSVGGILIALAFGKHMSSSELIMIDLAEEEIRSSPCPAEERTTVPGIISRGLGSMIGLSVGRLQNEIL